MKKKGMGNVKVSLEVVLGATEATLDEVAGLGKGSIVELPVLAGEPVVMKAGGQDFARGEVVVIDENYGIRLTELISDEG